MKKKIFYTITALTIFLCGCANFTDIEPKGKNLLNTAENLDELLNNDYQWLFRNPETAVLMNAVLPYWINIPSLIAEPVKTLNYVNVTWDESVDRVALTDNDSKYEGIYSVIGTICNPVILRADEVTGDQALARRVKAEAYVLRAWFHYLAVNLYAKAYNPATAATDGGIAYVFETEDPLAPSIKYTVGEVYDFILADLDAAFTLNSLPQEGVNRQRVGLSFAYAVQAKVLMSMRRYPEALTAARNSQAINGHIDNHNDLIEPVAPYLNMVFQRRTMGVREDLFVTITDLVFSAFSVEMESIFEPDAVISQYMPTYNTINDYPFDLSEAFYGVPGLKVWGSQEDAAFSSAGLTTVDMYLTEAECLLRNGELGPAKEKLEYIRERRIVADRYAPIDATTQAEIFALLKRLSRSDNFFTFKDFIDLKRWNTESEYAEILRKELLGVVYELAPDSGLWIFPFPRSATNFNTNLTQN